MSATAQLLHPNSRGKPQLLQRTMSPHRATAFPSFAGETGLLVNCFPVPLGPQPLAAARHPLNAQSLGPFRKAPGRGVLPCLCCGLSGNLGRDRNPSECRISGNWRGVADLGALAQWPSRMGSRIGYPPAVTLHPCLRFTTEVLRTQREGEVHSLALDDSDWTSEP